MSPLLVRLPYMLVNRQPLLEKSHRWIAKLADMQLPPQHTH